MVEGVKAEPPVYLFDWGDTLMMDFPDKPGKMCDWDHVQALDGAAELLSYLSKFADLYVATGAADSSEQDIQKAFARVGLDSYLSGYFCRANLGVGKDDLQFFPRILSALGNPQVITMVGDSLVRDIRPALASGIGAVWLSKNTEDAPVGVAVVATLRVLRECLAK